MLEQKTLVLSDEQRATLTKNASQFFIEPTGFKFIDDHFGLRPGKIHCLMSTSGKGKTTLTKSIFLNVAKTAKVLLFSTEETMEDVHTTISLLDIPTRTLSNISFVHEREIVDLINLKERDPLVLVQEYCRLFECRVAAILPKVVFFDNVTTSHVWLCLPPQAQALMVVSLSKIAESWGCSFFLVAHTAAGVKDDSNTLIAADDVRGSKSLTNSAQYLYVYQRFFLESSPLLATQSASSSSVATVRVLKSRGLNGNSGRYYSLSYSHKLDTYDLDKEIGHNQFNDIFKLRRKLSK